ncbi:unnamed protein product [Aureobasidium mustum]|uniref:Myb-like DNA-binding domain-containing protein n=1 Tax=Aureobasidium mustum TaxID=2773714 RepID=A0A9N8PMF3_9PEZI|nr:unnamed protein product [Aureobasidium mustum]
MPPVTKDEQIVLLFSCIKNSKGAGQIDWSGVATDTGLTTNAAKRYNKLANDYGVRGILRSSSGRVSAARPKNRAGDEEGEQGNTQKDSSRAKGKGRQTGREGGSKKHKMKHEETSEDEDENQSEKAVDYDALDAVDGEEEKIKAEPEIEDRDEEAVA